MACITRLGVFLLPQNGMPHPIRNFLIPPPPPHAPLQFFKFPWYLAGTYSDPLVETEAYSEWSVLPLSTQKYTMISVEILKTIGKFIWLTPIKETMAWDYNHRGIIIKWYLNAGFINTYHPILISFHSLFYS